MMWALENDRESIYELQPLSFPFVNHTHVGNYEKNNKM